MPLTKAQKQKIIDDLKEKISRRKAIVFVDFSGIKVKDLTDLRKKMREGDSELRVAKKTLISLAFKEKKIEIDFKKMEGEIALGFGYKDEVLPFKILYNFAKEHESFKILGGLIGNEFLGKDKSIELAQLLTREELLAKAVGSIRAPIFRLVNVLEGNLRGLVLTLNAIKNKN